MDRVEDKVEHMTGLAMVEQPRAIAVASPVEALALMSEAEFEQRLASLKKGQDRLARVKHEIMTAGTDYGVIPGTPKPTLLQPGAEKLCNLYHLVPTFDWQTVLGDGVTTPQIRVLMTCSLHIGTSDGPVAGQGVGTANTWEKKYRYRNAERVCPECGQPTISKSKEEYGGGYYCNQKRGGCGAKFKKGDQAIEGQVLGQVQNPDPHDVENTIVKMAAKRSYIDAAKRTTASSGLFTQDAEDMEPPTSARDVDVETGEIRQPAAKPAAAQPSGEPSEREKLVIHCKELGDALKERGVPVIGLTSRATESELRASIADRERVLVNLNKKADAEAEAELTGIGVA